MSVTTSDGILNLVYLICLSPMPVVEPSMSPDLSKVSDTAKPNVVRRKPGSGVGLMVNTFERMTACRRSRSFSSNQKVELPSVPESQPASNKPKC